MNILKEPPDDRWIRIGESNKFRLPKELMTHEEKERIRRFNPVVRKDILKGILQGYPYLKLIQVKDPSKRGFIFETICDILMASKYLIHNYNKYYKNNVCDTSLLVLHSFRDILECSIHQGDNPSDRTYMNDNVLYATSIKYYNKYGETDLIKLNTIMQKKNVPYRLSLIVKDKSIYLNHKYHNQNNPNKLLIDKVSNDNLLFDEKDVMKSFQMFQKKILSLHLDNIDSIIEWMDNEYLHNHKENLRLWFHQLLAFQLIMKNIENGEKLHLLSYKPRSGKTLILLYICKELLKTKGKILLMTSVMPDEILKSFINEIHKYNDFKDIQYKTQGEFMTIEDSFKGIIFCSVQYLKDDKHDKKLNKLKELDPDVTIFDECHFHSSNLNTYQKIIHVTQNKDLIKIFASGTSNKTLSFYNVPDKCNVKWDTEDENMMKKIDQKDTMDFMNQRHSTTQDLFKNLYFERKDTVICDYSRCPLQVLLQPKLPLQIIDQINDRLDNKGYNCSSLFALKQLKKSKKKDPKYSAKFQLDENNQGRRFLKGFLESIISNDPNVEDTMMRIIEDTQSFYKMDCSSEENPRLFLVFLPFGPNIGPIDMVEETLYNFIQSHGLWSDYHICYSSSKKTSSESTKNYSDFIIENMNLTKDKKKLGCILFLGNQGKVGITYKDCDVTISFDNGTNIDDAKQTYYRSMTEREGKTIGINVDFNIQRTLMYHNQVIRNYKKNTNTNCSLSKILQIMFRENLYIFNPHEMKMGDCHKTILDYFDKMEDRIKEEINIDTITSNIQCTDNLNEYIHTILTNEFISNKELDGKQKDCQTGESKKTEVDPVNKDDNDSQDDNGGLLEVVEEDESILVMNDINKTKNIYEYITKLACLLLRMQRKDPKNKNKNSLALLSSLKEDEKRIHIIYNRIHKLFEIDEKYLKYIYNKYIEDMDTESNITILDDIFEFYSYAKPDVLRGLIAKHFLPSKKQREENAEIPTSEECVDEMLEKIPEKFWTTKRVVLEPCCGKGNFVLAIFEKMFHGLTCIENEIERCRVIIEELLYFVDIDEVNVFITKELLTCHVISKLGEESWDNWDDVIDIYNFNFKGYVCNTLMYDPKKKFDAVIGNPPYQERNKNGKAKHGKSNLWTKFIDYSFDYLKPNGYLLFITPTSWMCGTVTCWSKMISNQVHYLNINECKRHFPGVGSTFSYYLIEHCDIYKDTDVVCKYKKKLYKSTIRLSKDIQIIPQLLTKESISIINKTFVWDNDKLFIRKDLIKHKDDCNGEKVDEYQHPVLTFIRRDGSKDTQYCKSKLFNQDYKKVLLWRSGYLNPTYENGSCGVGNNIHYAIVETEEEGLNLEKLYQSDLYKFIFSICAFSQYNNGRIMNWLHRKNPQYEDIYEYLNLDEEEKDFVINNL